MLTADLLRQVLEGALRGVFVGCPGTVTAYDPSTRRATVQPGTKRLKAPTAPGQAATFEALPPVPGVPVLWLGGGGFGAHAPLHEGDRVFLLGCDYDPTAFLRTGQVVPPDDTREHDVANAVAIAGFEAVGHEESSAMTLGHADAPVRLTSQRMEVDGSSDAAALASMLDKLIHAIKTCVISAGDGGAALKAAVATAFPSVVGSPTPTGPAVTSTGSTKIKTGG